MNILNSRWINQFNFPTTLKNTSTHHFERTMARPRPTHQVYLLDFPAKVIFFIKKKARFISVYDCDSTVLVKSLAHLYHVFFCDLPGLGNGHYLQVGGPR